MKNKKTYDSSSSTYAPSELFVKRLDSLTSSRAVLTKNTYFEGGDVLACHAGRFRFSFPGEDHAIELGPEEILVLYPGNIVTIEALERNNNLKYAIFGGTRVVDFFDSFGFYDRLRFEGDTQEELFDLSLRESEANIGKSLTLLRDALLTFSRHLAASADARLHQTLNAIQRAVRNGRPRIEAICEELGVSRSTMNRLLDEAGIGSPSDYLHAVQFRRARQLLQTTGLPIADIAKTMGFCSSVYFAEFIHRYAGMTPSDLRKSASV